MTTCNIVLLDIEGTTTPISFIHDCLFPYVTENLTGFLKENWNSSEFQSYIQLLREQALKDVENGMTDAVIIPKESESDVKSIQHAVTNNIQWQMRVDRKIAALKSFQGYMWKSGFVSGELKGVIYDDVVTAFKQWKDAGINIYIYSSGSVAAQKLLFAYSDKGNLSEYIDGYFDTTIGSKLESQSYLNIYNEIGIQSPPSSILFLSDNINEIIAAKKAGLQTAIVERPGNPPLNFNNGSNNEHILVIHSFLEVFTNRQ
ncbi:2881_t:CDS:2 [Ambispora gerdemannii]|uniref:Enolase-phosphatase E1 n=1 Tax=Ambispora gerdemannii TaxID=144530 RepID=A0A9N8WBX7_9GLOM|nr:2881_t:CDS:2 [Ambispora gerdemannii]